MTLTTARPKRTGTALKRSRRRATWKQHDAHQPRTVTMPLTAVIVGVWGSVSVGVMAVGWMVIR